MFTYFSYRDLTLWATFAIFVYVFLLFIIYPVCKATIDEMLSAVAKVDPKKRTNVGGYRMDSDGNSITRSVPYSKSETYLTELMENICKTKITYRSS